MIEAMNHRLAQCLMLGATLVVLWSAGCAVGRDANPPAASTGIATTYVFATPGALVESVISVTVIPTPSPAATVTPAKTAKPVVYLSPIALRYVIIERFGHSEAHPPIFYCEGDGSAVVLGSEGAAAEAWFAAQSQASAEIQGIKAHLGLSSATLTPAQQLLVYREHKLLSAVSLQIAGSGYRFSVKVVDRGAGMVQTGRQTDGAITPQGTIAIIKQRDVPLICLQ